MPPSTHRATVFGILSLPGEIHHLVFLELEPIELLSVGRTCKTFRIAVQERHLWLQALHLMCEREHAFEPSYPIESMSVIELQRAVLSPTLLRRQTCRPAELASGLLPSIERTLEWRPQSTIAEHFRQLHIIPGGRYVLAHTDASITLWDLKAKTPFSPLSCSPEVVATVHMENRSIVDRLSFPKPRKDGLLFAALVKDTSGATRCRVYEIGPLPKTTTIRSKGQLKFNDMIPHVHRVTMTEKYVLLHQCMREQEPNKVVIWNFSNGHLVFWSLLERKLARRSLAIAGDCLLGFTTSGILGWDLRDFMTERGTSPPIAKEVLPDFDIDYHDYGQREPVPYLFALNPLPTSAFQTNSEFLYEFVSKTGDPSGSYAVNRYSLCVRAGELNITFLSQRIISLPGPFHATDNPVHTTFQTYPSFCIGLYYPAKYFKLLISPVVTQCDSEWYNVPLKPPMHDVATGYSICPLTGRVVYICDGPHEENLRKIHLIDYSGN